jgi:sugar transferase (PEP-CTERM/EpsH1 system associated)
LKKGPGHLFSSYPQLHRYFREHVPDIVHTRNLAALEATVPAWTAGAPVRIHGEHGRDITDPDGNKRRNQWVRRAYSPFVTRYVALSTDLESYLLNKVCIARHRIFRICNGVDTERFRTSRTADPLPEGFPFEPGRHWIVGTVGRMDPIKDPANLARAFVEALSRNAAARERLRLVFVGDGECRAEVERVLELGSVKDLAWLAGERADVPELIRLLDCFVLPSKGEGISNTILEAMSSGLPVIATRVGGNAELVEDGITGRLVPAENDAAIAREILAYFGDPALARRQGRAGRSRAERLFSIDGMVGRYRDLYLDALRPSRRNAVDRTVNSARAGSAES